MQRVSRGRWRVTVALSIASGLVSLSAVAQQTTPARGIQTRGEKEAIFGLTAGGSWSDNIERVAADEEDGTIATAGVVLGFHQETRRLDTSIDANVAYEDYLDDTFDDGVVGGAAADVTAHLIPDRLLWILQDNFGQTTSDPFVATTPETRENINVFATGPDLLFGAGETISLRLSGRYTNTHYETSPIDTEQYHALIALGRRLSQTSSISLNMSGTRVNAGDASLATDYDRYEAFLHFEAQGARTALGLDAGYTTLEIRDESQGGVLVRASATRTLSPSSSVSLSIGSQFSDSAELFRSRQQSGGTNFDTSSTLTTSDPVENRFASLAYNFMRNRTGFGATVQYSDEDYENIASIDRKLTTWGAYASRRLTPMLELRIFADYEMEDFDSISFEDEELEAGAYLDWQAGRMISVRLQYDRFDRQSTSVTTEYTENRASLFITWSPIRSR